MYRILLFTLTVSFAFAGGSARAVAPRIIAYRNAPALGAAGRFFDSWEPPTINARGDVAFRAKLNDRPGEFPDARYGVWMDTGAGPRLVARQGDTLTSPAGAQRDFFSALKLDAAGRTNFSNGLQLGPGGIDDTQDESLWAERDGVPTLLLREGQPAPGAPGKVFGALRPTSSTSSNGHWAFGAILRTPGDPDEGWFPPSNSLWLSGDRGLEYIARFADDAPGMPEGVVFATYIGGGAPTFGYPRVDATGRVAFTSGYLSRNLSLPPGTGLWVGTPGALSLAASTLTGAPGTAGAFLGIGTPVLGDRGGLAFIGNLNPSEAAAINDSNNLGIWADVGSGIQLVAREGSSAPGAPAGALFDELKGTLKMNRNGEIAFNGRLRSGLAGVTSSNDECIWSDAGGALTIVAREGQQAPGTPAGALFGENFSSIGFNDSGQVAFLGRLQTGAGGVTSENDIGIWGLDPSGVMQLIVREGDMAEVAPGVLRTINYLQASDNEGNLYDYPSFNNRGQFAFVAGFPGFELAVMVSDRIAQAPGPSADYDYDGVVDGFDLAVWKNASQMSPHGDADGDGDSDGNDLLAWQRQLGGTATHSVPEPRSLAVLLLVVFRRRR